MYVINERVGIDEQILTRCMLYISTDCEEVKPRSFEHYPNKSHIIQETWRNALQIC